MCTIFSSGSNSHGQLGHGGEEDSHTFRKCIFADNSNWLPGTEIISIVGGANHTLILLREAGTSAQTSTQLWGAGDGRKGQLGEQYRQSFGTSSVFRRINIPYDGTTDEITAIASAWETSYVVISNSGGDYLLSSGTDDFGDIGTGAQIRRQGFSKSWQRVSFRHVLPESVTSIRIRCLKAGPHNVLAKLSYRTNSSLSDNEIIVGWGAARQGQLGPSQCYNLGKPQSFLSSPVKLDIAQSIQNYAIGNQHIVFLTTEGLVISLGSNRKNQLDGLSDVKDVVLLNTTWNGTYLIRNGTKDKRWTLVAGGSNTHGQLALSPDNVPSQPHEFSFGLNSIETSPTKIACGSEHVLVVIENSHSNKQIGSCSGVYGWGWNEHGNLGLGHTQDVHTPTLIWPDSDFHDNFYYSDNVSGIWAGCATSWIVVKRR